MQPKRAQRVLEQRQQAGTIKPGGMARLEALRAGQQPQRQMQGQAPQMNPMQQQPMAQMPQQGQPFNPFMMNGMQPLGQPMAQGQGQPMARPMPQQMQGQRGPNPFMNLLSPQGVKYGA